MNLANIDPQVLVIFGASGDLTRRKLIPAIFQLFCYEYLPDPFSILGVGRSPMEQEEFRRRVVFDNPFLKLEGEEADPGLVTRFAKYFHYTDLGGSYEEPEGYRAIGRHLEEKCAELGIEKNAIFYLSTPPKLYTVIADRLAAAGLTSEEDGWKRLIVEKPFGYNYRSGMELNRSLQKDFKEEQIFRIDHYLGKETVQNLLVTRFANSIFEPLWNRNYIHHIEITNAESVGVEGRGGYYDQSGALRDMFQNHLMQVLSLIAMEPPISNAPEDIRNEKVKALNALRVFRNENELFEHTIRGQYMGTHIEGEYMPGYREEEGVNPHSTTETYAAVKCYVDNWRWKDVPFYVRTAKRMPTKVTEVVVHFKTPHHQIFRNPALQNKDNILVIRIQPNEGMLIKFQVKVPGQGFQVESAGLDFYHDNFSDPGNKVLDAYARLLMDAMQGDTTLYARADEVRAAWKFVDPILDYWAQPGKAPMYGYNVGVWGPENADTLIDGLGYWRNPGPNLTDEPGYCIIC